MDDRSDCPVCHGEGYVDVPKVGLSGLSAPRYETRPCPRCAGPVPSRDDIDVRDSREDR